MNLNRLLMHRTAWVLLACLVATAALASWRARVDVYQEVIAARNAAQLMATLYGLETAPEARVPQEVITLQRLAGGLRHFTFHLEDTQGNQIAGNPATNPASQTLLGRWLQALIPYDGMRTPQTWMLRRPNGQQFKVTLLDNPWSEREEAWNNILGLFSIFLAYSALLWVCLYLTVRCAFAPMRSILSVIARWEQQDFAPRLPAMPVEELDKVGKALNKLVEAVTRSRDEQRQLLLKLETLQEDERTRLARELHDDFAQTATAIHADAAWLRYKVQQPEAMPVISDLSARCTDLQMQMRQVLRQLSPERRSSEDAPLPLAELLAELTRDWNRVPGRSIDFMCNLDVDSGAVPRSLALAIYRLTQEALTNIARHSGAKRVWVTLHATRGSPVRWSVKDDGTGIDDIDRAMRSGNGLAGMRERTWAHGGTFSVAGENGVALTAEFPRPEEEDRA